jgi:hypothetical protein
VVGGCGILLTTEVAGESLGVNSIGSEPEKLLLEDQTPKQKRKLVMFMNRGSRIARYWPKFFAGAKSA